MNSSYLQQAVEVIQEGGVIAYPTEAVWGLGCLPNNEQAVQRILDIKSRPVDKGLVLVGSSLDQFSDWLLPLSDEDLAKVQVTWPGPVTWVLPCYDHVPTWVRGQHQSLAVRISAHPLVKALCDLTGPLISTSANPSTLEPARTIECLTEYFSDQLDYILPGELGGRAQPSEIRTLTGERLR